MVHSNPLPLNFNSSKEVIPCRVSTLKFSISTHLKALYKQSPLEGGNEIGRRQGTLRKTPNDPVSQISYRRCEDKSLRILIESEDRNPQPSTQYVSNDSKTQVTTRKRK